jgi:hypothetical protein
LAHLPRERHLPVRRLETRRCSLPATLDLNLI